MEAAERRIFKLVILGQTGVGKSCILQRFCRETFSEEHIQTTAVDFVTKDILVADEQIKLYIWDTGDEEYHRDMIDFHCKPATGYILVYDITKEDTFKGMDDRIKHLKEIAQDKDPSFLLVGNKLDAAPREVNKEHAEKFAAENGACFIEVSAKTSTGISEVFDKIIQDITHKVEKKLATWTLVEDKATDKRVTKPHSWFGWHSNEKENTAIAQNEQVANTWLGWLTSSQGDSKRRSWPYKGAQNMIKLVAPYLTKSNSTVSDKVPEELTQDPFTLELYKLALLEGKELDRSIRVNIVGNYGQGKTTLMRRILNKDITNVDSTNAIDVEHLICQRTPEGKLSYSKNDGFDCSGLVKRLASVAKSTKEYLRYKASSFESKEKTDDDDSSKDTKATELMFDLSTSGEHAMQRSQETPLGETVSDSEITNSMETGQTDDNYYEKSSDENRSEASNDDSLKRLSMLSDEDKVRFAQELGRENSEEAVDDKDISVEFWDFGGQFIFYATHTIFHSRKAIYLLVLDLTSDLNEVAVDQDFPTESHERSMEYFVRFWINSIHSFVGSEDGAEPTVILVGTHKDKLKKNADAKTETFFNQVRKLFDGTKLLNHLYTDDFAVDNMAADDTGVAALREAIVEIGKQKAKTIEIPAKWIQLERSLKDHIHLKIITFDHVLKIDAMHEYPLGSVDQIRIFLLYHHSKGTFIYFDEEPISYYVVLDPQYLIDAFKCIITSGRFCKKDPEIRPLFNKLQSEGRLEQALIDSQWSKNPEMMYMEHKEILLAFLTKHHIISEATRYEEDTKRLSGLGWFVVPSLLRDECPKKDFEHLVTGKMLSKLRFVMEFENSTIVPTIYHRVVAAIVGKWPVIQFRENPFMYKNMCAVRLEKNHIGFTELRSDTIELSLANLCPLIKVEADICDRFRRFAEAVIAHEFRKFKSSKEVCSNFYAIKFRCNHEVHGLIGSKGIIECSEIETVKQIPCPDLESHAFVTADILGEWYVDQRVEIQAPNVKVTEKLLGKISKRIGYNWQTLGHELGVKQVQIEQIIDDHPHSMSMKIFVMLRSWSSEMAELATLDRLLEAMQKCPTLTVDWDEIRNTIDSLD